MNLLTITGADDQVDPFKLIELSKEFPFVEWAILHSYTRQGLARYPSIDWLDAFRMEAGDKKVNLAAHLCGEWSRRVQGAHVASLPSPIYRRIQLNGALSPLLGNFLWCARTALTMRGRQIILQARSEEMLADFVQDAHHNNANSDVYEGGLPPLSVLYDSSGGRGAYTGKWTTFLGRSTEVEVGYAGGIRPSNIVETLETITGLRKAADDVRPFWIDMETGVRDEKDRFDLKRVRDVLEKAAPFHSAKELP